MPTPSLILVPARFKTGKLYTPVATTTGALELGASGDFNVTRATTATRVNASGLIESVASGIPRLDYFLSSCPALLVEPSAQNDIRYSEDTATNWVLGANLSGTYENVIGVSGNNLEVTVSGSGIGANAGSLRMISINTTLASGSTYTISFLLKKTASHTIGGYHLLVNTASGGLSIGGGFNVSGSFSSGSIFNQLPTTNRIRRVEQWGTDVYRCSETFTMTASGTAANIYLGPTVSTTSNTNPAIGERIAFAAPQLELGAIPTSFIPTTTAAVTRNADVINLSGAVSGCIGQTEGTIYVDMIASPSGTGSNLFLIGDGTASNFMFIGKTNTKLDSFARVSGTTVLSNSTFNLTGNAIKVALAYKSGNNALYINGNLIASGTTAFTLTSGLTTIGFTSAFNFAASNAINKYNAVALYTTRLTNQELAALTTL
jgi:hypothetical protein